MLNIENSILIIIDIQEKLVKAAKEGEICAKNSAKLLKAANILNIPTIITEQYPKGLGKTVTEISQEMTTGTTVIEKSSFSAMLEPEFNKHTIQTDRKQVILCGIETHICVLQTAQDLIKSGFEVYIVRDGVSSRSTDERDIGLELAKQYGAKITGTEIVLFELLKTSKHPNFKEIQALIK